MIIYAKSFRKCLSYYSLRLAMFLSLTLLFLCSCNISTNSKHKLPSSIAYPNGWQISALTAPPNSKPAPCPLIPGKTHSGKIPGAKAYAIAFYNQSGWNNVVNHVLNCVRGYRYTCTDEGESGGTMSIRIDDSRIIIVLAYASRMRNDYYILSVYEIQSEDSS